VAAITINASSESPLRKFSAIGRVSCRTAGRCDAALMEVKAKPNERLDCLTEFKDAGLSSRRGQAMTKPIVWRTSARRAAGIAVMLTATILPNPVFASPPSGGDTVRGLYDALLGTMKNGRTLGCSGRFAQLQPVILKTFDLPTMARLSVGPSWTTMTENQRQQMTESFGRYISALYADRFDSYSGQKLEVRLPRIGGHLC